MGIGLEAPSRSLISDCHGYLISDIFPSHFLIKSVFYCHLTPQSLEIWSRELVLRGVRSSARPGTSIKAELGIWRSRTITPDVITTVSRLIPPYMLDMRVRDRWAKNPSDDVDVGGFFQRTY